MGYARNLRGRKHLERHGVHVPPGSWIVSIGPQTIQQLNLLARKATLALYFEHFRRPLGREGAYCAFWRTKDDFSASGIPEKLLEIFPKFNAMRQGAWDTRETFAYRHDLSIADDLFGFMARLRAGLYVVGLVVGDARHIENNDDGWTRPGDLLLALQEPDIGKRR